MSWDKAPLGVDGNAGFALLGRDLQEGEAEFMVIEPFGLSPHDWACAAHLAFEKLKDRLARPDLGFYFGPSHPWAADPGMPLTLRVRPHGRSRQSGRGFRLVGDAVLLGAAPLADTRVEFAAGGGAATFRDSSSGGLIQHTAVRNNALEPTVLGRCCVWARPGSGSR
jgi:hypothetical protein